MRDILIFWLLGLVILSCDTRLESLSRYNEAPYILVDGEAVDFVSDTMKARQGVYYDLRVSFFDPNDNISNIEYQVFSEAFGDLLSNGRLADGSYTLGDVIEYAPLTTGQHIFSITVKDKFDKFSSVDYDLLVLENQVPVTVVNVIENSQFSRTVDASGSFDPDQDLGGGILNYEFVFAGDTTVGLQSSQTYEFATTGIFRVQVRVQDNNEAWSDSELLQLVIE